jgi:hypothetical protein
MLLKSLHPAQTNRNAQHDDQPLLYVSQDEYSKPVSKGLYTDMFYVVKTGFVQIEVGIRRGFGSLQSDC